MIRNDQQSYWKENNTGNTGKISASVKNYFLMVTSVFSSCSWFFLVDGGRGGIIAPDLSVPEIWCNK